MKRISLPASILGLASVMFAPDLVEARSFRHEQVPNGERFSDCMLCHQNATGGARNSFGLDVQNLGMSGVGNLSDQDVVWAEICQLDSDDDGYTNGEELGDPNCEWTIGAANPPFAPTQPGNVNSTPCGNGTIEADEMCDGNNLNDMTCVDLGLPDGGLACAADCTFNTVNCVVAPNPNNQPGNNQNPTNNDTGGESNNSVGPDNNATSNNAPGNNSAGPDPDPDSPDEPNEPGGDLEPFFCDGEMSVEREEPAASAILFILFGLLGLRRLM